MAENMRNIYGRILKPSLNTNPSFSLENTILTKEEFRK